MFEDNDSKIEAILNWAEDHPKFDTDFVLDLQALDELSEAQEAALDNILERYRIDVEEWL